MHTEALLEWYLDAGVDEVIEDFPRNRLSISETKLRQAIAPGVTGMRESAPAVYLPPPAVILPADMAAAMAEARKLADAATDLAELERAVRDFNGCALKKTATKTVFCDGSAASRLMLIGEAPGASEDMQGIPFCGPSGQLLDGMMKAIGRDRNSFYITNTIFWRPPGNRQPNPQELAVCRPFVEKHVALLNPQLLVLVGGVAASAMLNTSTGITRLRGKLHSYRTPYLDRDIPVAVLFHPSYLLRQPAQKRLAWQDLLAMKAFLENL